jgi:signal transduction histidine kinase
MRFLGGLCSFKFKVFVAIGGLQFAGMVVVGLLVYQQANGMLREMTADRFRLEMERVSSEVAAYVADEVRTIGLLSRIPPIRSPRRDRGDDVGYSEESREAWERQLETAFIAAMELHPQGIELVYLDARNKEMAHVRRSADGHEALFSEQLQNRPENVHSSRANELEEGQFYLSSLADHGLSKPTFWLSVPIFDPEDVRRGVLALHVDPSELLARIIPPGEGGQAYLVDPRGKLLYHSHQALPFDPEDLAEIHPLLAEKLVADDAAKLYAACELEQMDGADHAGLCMHGYGRIPYDPFDPEHYWAIVFDVPAATVTALIDDLGERFVGWGGMAVILSLAVTLALSQMMVVRPVQQLSRAAEQVASGDLRPVIPRYDRLDRSWGRVKDEISRLYGSFGIMVEQLREATEHLQEQIRARTAELEASEARLEEQNGELVRLNSYKSRLLSVVSHELKTPLASLDGFARIINQLFLTDRFLSRFEGQERDTLEQVRRRIGRMDRNLARLIRLVDELLDFSRIDRGRELEMNSTRIDLAPILEEALEVYRDQARHKGLEIHYERASAGEDMWAVADPDRIRQVFDNLLNNAVKFTDTGSGIRVAMRPVEDFLEFSVRDSGAGIEPRELERIFDLYEQAGDEPSQRQGTGIGLSVAKNIVERHGGYIRAESGGRGAGSIFIFGIPRCETERKERQSPNIEPMVPMAS